MTKKGHVQLASVGVASADIFHLQMLDLAVEVVVRHVVSFSASLLRLPKTDSQNLLGRPVTLTLTQMTPAEMAILVVTRS